ADTPSDETRAYISAPVDMGYRADLAKPSSLFAAHWRELLPKDPAAIDRCMQRMIMPLVGANAEGKKREDFEHIVMPFVVARLDLPSRAAPRRHTHRPVGGGPQSRDRAGGRC